MPDENKYWKNRKEQMDRIRGNEITEGKTDFKFPQMNCVKVLPSKAQEFIEKFPNIVSFPCTKNLLYSVGFKTIADEDIYWHTFYIVVENMVLQIPYTQMSKNHVISHGQTPIGYIRENLYPQHVLAVLKKDVKINRDKIIYDKITVYLIDGMDLSTIIEDSENLDVKQTKKNDWLYEYYEGLDKAKF